MLNKTLKIILWYEPPKRHLNKTEDFVMENSSQKFFFTWQRFNIEVNVIYVVSMLCAHWVKAR